MTKFPVRISSAVLLSMMTSFHGLTASERAEPMPGPGGRTESRAPAEPVYVVEKGDTLYAIARRYSVTTMQLQYRNEIRNPRRLQVGARLAIPERSLRVPPSYPFDRYRFIWPVKEFTASSEFGARGNAHEGIDLRARHGAAIRASADGVVHFVGRQRAYGKVVVLQHAGNVRTLYAHNDRNLVHEGQRVKQGEVIATVGDSGNASGYHVHFEFIESGRKLNPRRRVGIDEYASIN